MKKKFVSSIVFMILVAGFQARAQESVVDNSVTGVENEDKHLADSESYTFMCESVDSENPLVLKIKNGILGNAGSTSKVILEGNESGFAGSSYSAVTTFEDSDLFKKYDYKLVTDDGISFADLTLVYSMPLQMNISQIGNYCGRALCKPLPISHAPKCGRGGCDDDLPNTNPVTKYKGILKMHEKELNFTCQ